MPRYHFHVTDGKEVVKNPNSLELPGDAAAREEAMVLARDLKQGNRKWDGWFVEIRDDHGHHIDTVPIDALPDD